MFSQQFSTKLFPGGEDITNVSNEQVNDVSYNHLNHDPDDPLHFTNSSSLFQEIYFPTNTIEYVTPNTCLHHVSKSNINVNGEEGKPKTLSKKNNTSVARKSKRFLILCKKILQSGYQINLSQAWTIGRHSPRSNYIWQNYGEKRGRLCFDGNEPEEKDKISQPEATENEEPMYDTSDRSSVRDPEKTENDFESSQVTWNVDSNSHKRRPSEISRKIQEAMAGKFIGGIYAVKDSLRMKIFSKIYDQEFILREIDRYNNKLKRKKASIARQRKLINMHKKKKKVKTFVHKKYYYVNVPKQITTMDLEPMEKMSTGFEMKPLADFEESVPLFTSKTDIEPKVDEEVSEDSDTCIDSERTISCPSETDSEGAPCKCSKDCTCNEYARFKVFMFKKKQRKQNNKKISDEKLNIYNSEIINRWPELHRLEDSGSPWSEETDVEVTSTSSSSCDVVRKCHCYMENCGCDEYRDYLKYKLYQVKARKRRRNFKRAKVRAKLQNMINKHYEEDEYNKKIREFIQKYYVDKNNNIECPCGIYNCYCMKNNQDETINEKEMITDENEMKPDHIAVTEIKNGKKEIKNENKNLKTNEKVTQVNPKDDVEYDNPTLSLLLLKPSASSILKVHSSFDRELTEEERKKVWFGKNDPPTACQNTLEKNTSNPITSKTCVLNPRSSKEACPTKSKDEGRTLNTISASCVSSEKKPKREESMDFYQLLSSILKDTNDIMDFDIDDYIHSRSTEVVKEDDIALHESSFDSFDFKKNLLLKKCVCSDYIKYYNFKKKVRRLAEKKDPLSKYFRKRIYYLSKMIKTKKLLEQTSSETDAPVIGPLMEQCQKYTFEETIGERRKKLFKKKQRKFEKKFILELISKGSHLYPCECVAGNKRPEDFILEVSTCECEVCECTCPATNELNYKTKNIQGKTKIDPSIELGHFIKEKDCILGTEGTFPECLECKHARFGRHHINFAEKINRLKKQNQEVSDLDTTDISKDISGISKCSPKEGEIENEQSLSVITKEESKAKSLKDRAKSEDIASPDERGPINDQSSKGKKSHLRKTDKKRNSSKRVKKSMKTKAKSIAGKSMAKKSMAKKSMAKKSVSKKSKIAKQVDEGLAKADISYLYDFEPRHARITINDQYSCNSSSFIDASISIFEHLTKNL